MFTGVRYDAVVVVAEALEPITTMGGVRLVPDLRLADLDPEGSSLLILPGATMGDGGEGSPFAAVAARFLGASVPVAAICGATAGLARAGLLDDRDHTSAAAQYVAATGYRGGRATWSAGLIDGDLVTAGPQSPVPFAPAVLERLGLAAPEVLEAYEAVFDRADASAYPALTPPRLRGADGADVAGRGAVGDPERSRGHRDRAEGGGGRWYPVVSSFSLQRGTRRSTT